MANREEIERALDRWRDSEQLLRQHPPGQLGTDDERAVEQALGHLQRSTTLQALVAADVDDSPHTEDGAWLASLCRTPSGRVLSPGLVKDAAFWRRARALQTRPAPP